MCVCFLLFVGREFHDEVTHGFHMLANIAGETYGFWVAQTVSLTGETVTYDTVVRDST